MRTTPWGGRLRALARNRVLAVGSVSLSAVAIVIAAVAANGAPVQHVDANDGAVWLTDDSLGQYGRFDAPVGELNLAFGPPGAFQKAYSIDVLQGGATVLAEDRARGALYPVSAQAGRIAPPPAALPATAAVAFGGQVAAVLDTSSGKLWAAVVGAGPEASLDPLGVPDSAPLAQIAGATAVAVAQDGSVFAASSQQLTEIPFSGAGLGAPRSLSLHAGLGREVALTTVGDQPVLLDPSHQRILDPSSGASTAVPDAGGTSGSGIAAVLQQPGPASDVVVVATGSALYSVPLDRTGRTRMLASGGDGSPAQPVVFNGCIYAAWAGSPGYYARSCGDGPAHGTSLPGEAAVTSPVFRVNNDQILLNDTSDGATWSLNGPPVLVLNESDWKRILLEQQHPTQNQSNTRPTSGTTNRPPTAVDQQLKARPGRVSVLHILDGCTDPAGSVLSVAGVSPAVGGGYRLQIAPDLQTVAVTLDQNQAAPIHFQYTIVDARGQSATASATVSPTGDETPPHLLKGHTPVIRYIASGASATYQVMGEWRDDESDALSVSDASASPGTTTWTGDGLITYTAPVVQHDTPVSVTYHVTDGLSAPVADVLRVVVLGRGDTTQYPATANPDAADVIVGQPTEIAPLANDVPGADPLHPDARLGLAGPVAPPAGLPVSSDVAAGKLTITAAHPGLYSFSYGAAFGSAPVAAGQVLIDAVAASSAPQPPVTTPATALLRGQNATTVDVLSDDYDPGGGLLTVLSTSAPDGIEATVEQGEWLRLVATTPGLQGQLIVTYEVTNGLTDPVTGQVAVSWLPPLPPAPPVAPLQRATVRAGDETDLAVLQTDSDPGGERLTLDADHVTVTPDGAGAASVAGGVLRYAAPAADAVTAVTQVTVSYIVANTSGESTTGQVLVTINPADPVFDSAPAPGEVDARVTAGDTITINIPTTGVDPDGDSVAVSQISDPPQQGRVLSVSTGSITYQAYPLSAGTDSMGYEVENPSGLTGSARLRISVTPPTDVPPPVAVDQTVTAAPGATVLVDLLGGDIVATGDAVGVEPLAQTNASVPAGAQLLGQDAADLTTLRARAPTGGQPLVLTYGITDGVSPPSLAQVTVRAVPGYKQPPLLVDQYPAPPSPGRATLTVDALRGDVDPSGQSSGGLRVAAVFGGGVQVRGGTLVVPVRSGPRAVAYVVRDAAGAEAVAVAHVPAPLVGPHLRAGALIQMPRGGSTTVAINSYISDSKGPVSLVSMSDVFVSPAASLSWQPGSYTSVVLTGLGSYDGPGALTVTVTDGSSPQDPRGHTATLSIPVQVGPPTPVLRCPSKPVQLVQGGTPVRLRLASFCAVWTPDPHAAATLPYAAQWTAEAAGVGLGFADSGHRILQLTPSAGSVPGETGAIAISVPGTDARAALTVAVGADTPLRIAPIVIGAARTGQAVSIDVRGYATSPLADPHVQVVGVSPPSGGNAATSFSGSVVTITPLTHGTLTFTVQVTDVPGRTDRVVTGGISMQVLDVPGQPGSLQGVPGNGQVALSWTASDPNGAPVDYYQVTTGGGATMTTAGTTLTWPGLANGTAYQFSVRAHNAVGIGPPSAATFIPVSVPGAPGPLSATPGNGQVALVWGAAPAFGAPVDSYLVTIDPAPASAPAVQTVAGGQTSYTWSGLDNNSGPYTFTVAAHNGQGIGPPAASAAVYAHGAPPAPPAPAATGGASPDQSTTTVTVAWAPISRCNDARPCASYTVTELRNGSAVSSQTVASACPGATSSLCATFGPLGNDGSSYTYTLQATNQEQQTSPPSAASQPPIQAVGVPGQITDLRLSDGNQAEQATFTLPAAHGGSIVKVDWHATNQSGGTSLSSTWLTPGSPGQQVTESITGLTNGDTYGVTVDACNATLCAAPSNTAAGAPYGPPAPPVVDASPYSPTQIRWGWSGGGGNGRPLQYICLYIDGGNCNRNGYNGQPGALIVTYPCGESHTMDAAVIDSAGQLSARSSLVGASTQACGPTQSLHIAFSTTYCCTQHWVAETFTNFGQGTFTYYCHGNNNGFGTVGPYYVSIPQASPPYTNPYTIDNGRTCWVSGSGSTLYVEITAGPGIPAGGIMSNTLTLP